MFAADSFFLAIVVRLLLVGCVVSAWRPLAIDFCGIFIDQLSD
jgi:hypothetical protein